jgi:hypothetical protein
MVASLVLRGILDRDLLEDSVGEYIGFYALLKPFLKQVREAMRLPSFMKSIERLVEESQRGRDHLAAIEIWLAAGKSSQKA